MKPITFYDGPIINNKYYGDRSRPPYYHYYAQEVQEARTIWGLIQVTQLE